MAAFSEAQIAALDSPHTHFKPNYSSIIQLLKASETMMVHWGVVWLKIYAVRGVWTHPRWSHYYMGSESSAQRHRSPWDSVNGNLISSTGGGKDISLCQVLIRQLDLILLEK